MLQGQPKSKLQLILVSSVFILISSNQHFYAEFYKAFFNTRDFWLHLASVSLLCLCLTAATLSIFSIGAITQYSIVLLLGIAFLSAHFTDQYGTIISQEMIENALQTNWSEAQDLLNSALLIRGIFLFVLPSIFILKTPVKRYSCKNDTLSAAGLSIGFTALAVLVVLSSSSFYASFFREYKALRYYVTPLSTLYAASQSIGDHLIAHGSSKEFLSPVEKNAFIPQHREKELMIMVVGETARYDRFNLDSGQQDITPHLATTNDAVLYRGSACGTSTAFSVPCMFSLSEKSTFDIDRAKREENVLDLLHRLGVKILWRDNNSNSKGVAERTTYQDYQSPKVNPVCDTECRDIGMLSGLQEYITKNKDQDLLIILHQMGSHGPAYYKRYPKEFEHFSPACRTTILSQCSQQEINNAYNNSIRYTDYFLFKAIELLKSNQQQFNVSLLYASDHGESLGEGYVYLHGLPYSIAPKQQKIIPILLWMPQAVTSKHYSVRAAGTETSHDAISRTLLEFFEVEGLKSTTPGLIKHIKKPRSAWLFEAVPKRDLNLTEQFADAL